MLVLGGRADETHNKNQFMHFTQQTHRKNCEPSVNP